jgi:hypothetical protein
VLWQSLAERDKGRADLLKDAAAKEQRIIDLERELKEVCKAALPIRRSSRMSSPRKGARSWRPLHNLTLRLLVGSVSYPFWRRGR